MTDRLVIAGSLVTFVFSIGLQAQQTAVPATDGRASPGATTQPARAQMPSGTDSTELSSASQLHRLGDLMDARLRNTQGEELGEIEDFAIDERRGQVAYAILARGQVLDMGGRRYAIPFNALRTSSADGKITFTIDATAAQLEQAGSFEPNQWPDMSDPAWQERVGRAFGVGPYWVLTADRERGREDFGRPDRDRDRDTFRDRRHEDGYQARERYRDRYDDLDRRWSDRDMRPEFDRRDRDRDDRWESGRYDRFDERFDDERRFRDDRSARDRDWERDRFRERDRFANRDGWEERERFDDRRYDDRYESRRDGRYDERYGPREEAWRDGRDRAWRDREPQAWRGEERYRDRDDRSWRDRPDRSWREDRSDWRPNERGFNEQEDRFGGDRGRERPWRRGGRSIMVRGTEIRNCEVQNPQGQDLGDIDDLVIDITTGRIAYAVLSYGGFLGIGDKLFAVPWAALELRPEANLVVLDIPRSRLQRAEGFDKDNWPNMANPQWSREIHEYYGVEPSWRPRAEIFGEPVSPTTQPAGRQAANREYNAKFDASKIETVTGTVQSIERVRPMNTASRVLAVMIRSDDGRTHVAHLGPANFVLSRQPRLRIGDQVTIKGSRVSIDGRDVLMTTVVTKDDTDLRLRQDDGRPMWSQQDLEHSGARGRQRPSESADQGAGQNPSQP